MKSLRELRSDLDVTQEEVAEYVGVANATISQYESGVRTPSLNTAKKIASYFNVPVESIKFGVKKGNKKRRK